MTIAPYGTWTSPLSAADVARASVRLSSVLVDGDDVYWLEGRPLDGGRQVVVCRTADGRTIDVTPAGTDVRTRVHEYGGGAYAVADGVVYFSEGADDRLYRLSPGTAPVAITPPGPGRYADLSVDPSRRRLVCVREDHALADREPAAAIVLVRLDRDPPGSDGGDAIAGDVVVLVSGDDFYAAPRISADGARIAWLSWRHPQMPWDGTELWAGAITADGRVERATRVAGGPHESVFQPGWSDDGTLYVVSDRSGFWNLYRCAGAGDAASGAVGRTVATARVVRVHETAAELGRPLWQLGTTTWAFAGSSRVVAAAAEQGRWRLVTIDLERGAVRPVPADLAPGESVAATATHAICIGGTGRTPDAVVRVDLASGSVETLRAATVVSLDEVSLSIARPLTFPTSEGRTAHAFYYPPRHAAFEGPAGERPPLLVIAHGGPTAAATDRLNLEVQFWTTRGFAVVDVNYGGSSGFGRAYRERLRGQWGVVDVDDVVHAAMELVRRHLAEPGRLVIRGRSAGGFTVLAALTAHPGVFAAGASYYGIADLERLAAGTHKFESRYLDGLVGPYPADRDVYRARSPIHAAARLACPVIFFQGLEDAVVPPEQASIMADALGQRGLPVELVTFATEGHGFRRAETIERCLETELRFYGAALGFTPAV